MKITKVNGLKIADRVVTEMRKLKMREIASNDVYARSYSDGREQGLLITHYINGNGDTKSAAVFECRNSDEIVVAACDWTGHVSDADYKARRYFSPGEYKKAALELAKIIETI